MTQIEGNGAKWLGKKQQVRAPFSRGWRVLESITQFQKLSTLTS